MFQPLNGKQQTVENIFIVNNIGDMCTQTNAPSNRKNILL